MYIELKISLLILKTYVDKNKILRKSPNYFKWHCNLFYHIVLDALSKQLLVINILSAIGINYFFGMSLRLKWQEIQNVLIMTDAATYLMLIDVTNIFLTHKHKLIPLLVFC